MTTGRTSNCTNNTRDVLVQAQQTRAEIMRRDDEQLMVTRKEAARRLSLCVSEIDYARRRGDLTAQRYGSKVLISVDELRRFAKSLPADELS